MSIQNCLSCDYTPQARYYGYPKVRKQIAFCWLNYDFYKGILLVGFDFMCIFSAYRILFKNLSGVTYGE